MKITEATTLIENYLNQTDNNSLKIIFQKYLSIFEDLQKREFSDEELNSIENKLDNLQLNSNPKNQKRYFRRKLNALTHFLMSKFSLVTKGAYLALGISLGTGFGLALGTSILGPNQGTTTGLLVGMVLGIIIGKYMDSNALKNNKVIFINQ